MYADFFSADIRRFYSRRYTQIYFPQMYADLIPADVRRFISRRYAQFFSPLGIRRFRLTQLSLLTTHYSPLTTHYSPLTTHYSPLTTHYSIKLTFSQIISLIFGESACAARISISSLEGKGTGRLPKLRRVSFDKALLSPS